MSDCGVCLVNYYDEVYEDYVREDLTAETDKKCCECRETIPQGAQYQFVAGTFDAERYEHATCLICAEIRTAFTCNGIETVEEMWQEGMPEYVFPELTTANKCFQKLGPAAKEMVLSRWRTWKGIQ